MLTVITSWSTYFHFQWATRVFETLLVSGDPVLLRHTTFCITHITLRFWWWIPWPCSCMMKIPVHFQSPLLPRLPTSWILKGCTTTRCNWFKNHAITFLESPNPDVFTSGVGSRAAFLIQGLASINLGVGVWWLLFGKSLANTMSSPQRQQLTRKPTQVQSTWLPPKDGLV